MIQVRLLIFRLYKESFVHRDVVKAASFIEEHAPDAIAVVDAVRNEDFGKLNEKQLQLAFKVSLLYTKIKIALVHLAKDQIKDPKQPEKLQFFVAIGKILESFSLNQDARTNEKYSKRDKAICED